MNLRQEIALYLSVAALVATWLFPPWLFERTITNGHTVTWAWIEHHFILNPPHGGAYDWQSLLRTDLSIIAVGTSIVYALRTRL